MPISLTEKYWTKRYKEGDTGWDIGYVLPPLKAYFDQLKNKDLKILIPGAGNAYEAEYLFLNGFKQVFVADWSKTALNNFKARVPDFPLSQLIHANFFNLDSTFDIIVEQTFFCAITPQLRPDYVLKVNQLLKENGKLVGVLFNGPLNKTEPPFGGSKTEYINLFLPYFNIAILEACYNSIPKRLGNELFFKFIKPKCK